jgi:hypothetical protein
MVIAGGCVTVWETVAVVHPLASLTVEVYTPLASPLPVVCDVSGLPVHEKVHGAVPPVWFDWMYASLSPKQLTCIPLRQPTKTGDADMLIAEGCVICTVLAAVHPLLSFTVAVYVAAENTRVVVWSVSPAWSTHEKVHTDTIVPPLGSAWPAPSLSP